MALASPGGLDRSLLFGETQHASLTSTHSRAYSERPRLFYSVALLKEIKRMLSLDVHAKTVLKQRGEELLRAELVPESIAEIGGGQQANYRTPGDQIANMGLTLGLLYHLTDDKRYAAKLRHALLFYADYARWAGPGLAARVPPWHSVLETTGFCFGYSAGYDALRAFLSDADRKTILGAMVRLGTEPILNDWLTPGKRIHSLDSMGHNWWGVCITGAGLCGLALLGDEPRAEGWIRAVDAGFAQWFEYEGNIVQNRMPTFERSGPSYEGINYTNYGLSQYLHYRLAWQNTFPGRKPAHMVPLDHVAAYFLHTLYPASTGFLTVNFDDSPAAVDATETLLLMAACGIATPDATRYLARVHTHPQSTLLALVQQSPLPAARTDPPTSCIYGRMGWATMRDSWDSDATLLAMKSGFTWNHAHADAGTFVLYRQGKPLIIDSGTCQYSRPEYTTYYRTSRAHNVVLFNNEGQPAQDIGVGCKFAGRMHCLIDGHGLKYCYADATGPMAKWFTRNYRHWIWSGDVILIVDDVRAHTEGQLDWLLHYAGDCTVDASSAVKLVNAPAGIMVRMLYPPHRIEKQTGLAEHDPDKKTTYLAFRPSQSASVQQFLTVIDLNPEARAKCDIVDDPNYLGVRIETTKAIEEFYISRRAIATPGTVAIQIGEWTTDSYLLHMRRQVTLGAEVERFFVGDGSYLRRSDRSVFESLSKITACWSPEDTLEVFSDDSSSAIQIAAAHSPGSVRWNRKAIATEYDSESNLVSLHRAMPSADARQEGSMFKEGSKI